MSYSEVERRVYQAQVDYIFASGFNHTPHAYIDIAGGLVEGTLLSQIMFWFSPTNDGKRKTRIYKDGYAWIAKTRNDWWNEIRITPKQYDRAIGILVDMGLVETKLFKFNSVPTIHIRPVYENISIEIDKWRESVKEDLKRQEKDLEYPQGVNPILPKGENGNSPKVKMDIDERDKSITEITTENNTGITNNIKPQTPKGVRKQPSETVKQIIDYLNEVCKTKFSPKTENTIKAINGRLNDGFTIDDFKTVIDKKAKEWTGTEMQKFLRPETLFRPSKFESYLNEKVTDKQEMLNDEFEEVKRRFLSEEG